MLTKYNDVWRISLIEKEEKSVQWMEIKIISKNQIETILQISDLDRTHYFIIYYYHIFILSPLCTSFIWYISKLCLCYPCRVSTEKKNWNLVVLCLYYSFGSFHLSASKFWECNIPSFIIMSHVVVE